ncbi:hypothetical protein ACQEU8_11105 [Streptomyces sp. CA-250714]|uniref:hypothetical protein n=1 Tax=Streptomyces sp. CA-250714 TaxID=3240060 RepID=UPI003D8E076B
MHQPGRPEDLDAPLNLWVRAATMAVAAAAGGFPDDGLLLDEDGLAFEGGGACWWWRLRPAAGGEAVFCGQDADAGNTHLRPVPLDVLAGLPARLGSPTLREELGAHMLGYVYWYTEGAWHRVPYPDDVDDDGLAMSHDFLESDGHVVEALLDHTPERGVAAQGAVRRFLAGARACTLAPGDVSALLAALAPRLADTGERLHAARNMAARTGLIGGDGLPPALFDIRQLPG